MSTTTATPTLSMKLLIDRRTQRVLFAEASKDVVDFLFSLLTLPVATAVKLVGKDALVGCVCNLYASVEKLDSVYLQAGVAKEALLCPKVVLPAANTNSSLLRLPEPPVVEPNNMYRCTGNTYGMCRTYITDEYGKMCPHCRCSMTTAAQYLLSARGSCGGSGQVAAPKSAAGGFVQGIVVTYTVQDDLTVTPVSSISSVSLLSTFSVRDIYDLQEKTVQLGYNEGLAIFKASLKSKSVLTDVFLHGKN
ncbi:uncharacterized protein [Zea mays]|uniref:DUF674 family protein n=1 Tax=Zea mays TaxID=4577 RepID=A0A1D6ML74_MAIZE|nr:uncharacterized protein LOC103649748 [Zea mays]ONM29961.1 DUF674 family protein [Zea mays]|eukprot:XP_020406258.1 uncharacterized protein LOC103649748 [Zea mays]